MVNGYGKNYNDAFAAGITNFIDKLFEEEKYHNSLRDCLKKFTNPNDGEKIKTQPDTHH